MKKKMKKTTATEGKKSETPRPMLRIINGVVVSEEEWRDHHFRRDPRSVSQR